MNPRTSITCTHQLRPQLFLWVWEEIMRFCQRYEGYVQAMREKHLPYVGYNELKKQLLHCTFCRRGDSQPQLDRSLPLATTGTKWSESCTVCDGTFFPSLLKEIDIVAGFFNIRAKKLLKLRSSGFRRYLGWFRNNLQKNDGVLMQESNDMVTYAVVNSIAMNNLLKIYDKVHYSKQGQAFRSAQNMHIDILHSPLLCQLMALYINMMQRMDHKKTFSGLYDECSLIFIDDKPILSYGSFDHVKIEIDLTCPICLETVFDSISLNCGHILCYMCGCSTASVSIIDGLRAADPKAKCPLCRQEGVYQHFVHLGELDILLSRSCPDYWEKRLKAERVERVRMAKEHWESKCREFLGV